MRLKAPTYAAVGLAQPEVRTEAEPAIKAEATGALMVWGLRV